MDWSTTWRDKQTVACLLAGAIIFIILEQNFRLNANVFAAARCLPIAFTFLTDVRSRLETIFENLKCTSGHVEFSFNNTAENFWPKLFRLKFENNYQNYYFSKKLFFLKKKFIWTRRMLVWHPCQKNSAKSPKTIMKLYFFHKKFPLLKYSSKTLAIKKAWILFISVKCEIFCRIINWKCLFCTNIKVLQKCRKFLNFWKIKSLMKFFSKNYFFILLKGFFNKVGGRKISRLNLTLNKTTGYHQHIFRLRILLKMPL